MGIKERFEAISDIRMIMHRLGIDKSYPNPAIYLKSVNEEDMIALENEDADYKTEIAAIAYKEKRQNDYIREGVTVNEMIVALWEKIIEDRPEIANELQAKRGAIKIKYPKAK